MDHAANEIMGTVGFIHQVAENRTAVWKQDESLCPAWASACLDISMFTREVPGEKQIDGPPPPERDVRRKKSAWLLSLNSSHPPRTGRIRYPQRSRPVGRHQTP